MSNGFRWLSTMALLAVVVVVLPALAACTPAPTATPSATATATAVPSPRPTQAATATPPGPSTPTPVATPVPSPTGVATATPPVAPTPTVTPPPATPAPGQRSVTIDLVARDIAFNMSTISVPVGAAVTVNFDNQDTGFPHNFAVYQITAGGQTTPVFVGGLVMPPAKTTYQFTAPQSEGNYFFECDVHPDTMNGKFVVYP